MIFGMPGLDYEMCGNLWGEMMSIVNNKCAHVYSISG